nr:MAG TPA: hypothetical protein [Caudoviricetes sp.]
MLILNHLISLYKTNGYLPFSLYNKLLFSTIYLIKNLTSKGKRI